MKTGQYKMKIRFNFFFYYHGGGICTASHMCQGQDNFVELVLSFQQCGFQKLNSCHQTCVAAEPHTKSSYWSLFCFAFI